MQPPPLLSYLESSVAAVRSLPLGAHAIPVVLLICGLIFWLCGGRFLKQLFVLTGIVAGAGLGAIMAPQVLPDQIGSVPGSYVGMGVGGALGCVGSFLAFRFAMALCGALIIGAAGALGVGVYLSHQPDALPLNQATEARDHLAPAATDLADQYHKAVDEYGRSTTPTPGTPTQAEPGQAPPTVAAAAADATRQFADEVAAEVKNLWDTTPEHSRLLLLLGGGAGALLGAGAGMAMPKRAAAVVTAVLGAGFALLAGGWLAHALDLPGQHLITDRGPLGLLLVWTTMAVFGVIVQLRSGKPKAAPAPAPAPAPAKAA